MSKKKNYAGLSGKIGGLAVKGMIRDVEQRLMNGEHIPAGASSPEEAAELAETRRKNQESAEQAHTEYR